MFSPVKPSLDPWPILESDEYQTWSSVHISEGVYFLMIADSSGVLMTTDCTELQLQALDAPENIQSVHLAFTGDDGLRVEQVSSALIFEESRPAGGVRHYLSFQLVSGFSYSSKSPPVDAVGRTISIYKK
ncbi:hypothetical protein GCM10009304_30210 [Pseudomonas matsuisoli]|uniref:Uncharacterized protein n=1 Tax=Pseudomonas matsuisoli TaxID=1515666 RepID=A0A917Q0F4_9PSED|nr:hypothetical protein GCM10009304_30210 [Pseudomonas matsuisoli]